LREQDVEIRKQVFHFIIFSPKPYGSTFSAINMGASPIPPQKGRANQLTGQQGISSRLFSPLHFALRQKLGGVGRGSVYLSKQGGIACDNAERRW